MFRIWGWEENRTGTHCGVKRGLPFRNSLLPLTKQLPWRPSATTQGAASEGKLTRRYQ
jgi:hypothetical protein